MVFICARRGFFIQIGVLIIDSHVLTLQCPINSSHFVSTVLQEYVVLMEGTLDRTNSYINQLLHLVLIAEHDTSVGSWPPCIQHKL